MVKKLCKPQSIVDGIEAIDNNADKLNYIKNVLDSCSLVGTPQKKTKKKRRPSGYNLFIGECMKPTPHYLGKPMKECAADWKTANKETWNQKAKEGV